MEVQPTHRFESENMDMEMDSPSTPRELDQEIPDTKSSVGVDMMALEALRSFEKGERVHMAYISAGKRKKGTFSISRARVDKNKSYWEYQLLDDSQQLFDNGKWIREKELKREGKR